MRIIPDNIFIFILTIITTSLGYSQKVENPHFEQSGKQIIIYYDLIGAQPDQTCEINVLCSTDGGKTFGTPLKEVSGDVGPNIKVGNDKKIIWDVLAEIEKLEGDIVFEVYVTNTLAFGLLTDTRDGNTYKTIKIGSQEWMAEDLNYNNKSVEYILHGNFYGFPNVVYEICPTAWHVPDYSDWMILFDELGGVNAAGGKMKETGFLHWTSPNIGATNESGYSALPAGYIKNGNLVNKGFSVYFMNYAESYVFRPTGWELRSDSEKVKKRWSFDPRNVSGSVRCIKD
jgi:uncharacterized protein (TIGR02145 family)